MESLTFQSSHNKVELKEGKVYKQYEEKAHFLIEKELLTILTEANVAVPRIVAEEEGVLVLSYLPGETLSAYLARMEREQATEEQIRDLTDAVANWLRAYYMAVGQTRSGIIRGDISGNNFLISGQGIAGVDFETCMFGSREQDAGRLLAKMMPEEGIPSPFEQRVMEIMLESLTDILLLDRTAVLNERDEELADRRLRHV